MIIRYLTEFQIEQTLGVGTVGTVYRALDTRTGHKVALKILMLAVSQDETIHARFTREMVILEKLDHPNIVKYYGGGHHGGQLFYAMELVDGATLKDVLIRNGSLSWEETIECGWQICSALQHAHNHGIVHRDLKPANLFVSRDGSLKLGDFGIALDTGEADITATGLTVGSYLYMAPEQIRGETGVSGQTDLYALGCLLFEMLAHRAPFQGTNFAQIFDQHLHGTAPNVCALQADCPPQLAALISELLEKDPQNRPFNARAVQGMLAEVMMQWDEGQDSKVSLADLTKKLDGPILVNLLPTNHGPENEDVSWAKLACVVAITVVVLAVLRMLQN